MKKAPSILSLDTVLESSQSVSAQINGKWVAARPCGFFSIWYRLKAAWGVFRGKYDAVYWPEGQ